MLDKRAGLRAAFSARFVVAAVAALLTFSVPLLVIEASSPSYPEVRVVEVNGTLSSYVTSGAARILVLSVTEARDARTLLGRIRHPWQAVPTALVTIADDAHAAALYSALEQTDPRQVIVLGVPGADPTWTAVERLCEERSIQLDYVAAGAVVQHDQVQLQLRGGEAASLIVRANELNIAIGLTDVFPTAPASVVVSDAEPTAGRSAALLISKSPLAEGKLGSTELIVERNGSVTLVIEPGQISVYGGQVRQFPAAPTNALPTPSAE